MSGQTRRPTRSLALIATLLMWGAGIGVPTNTARADDCLTAPNSPAPEGSHWYYRTDRATQRKCWYVRATDQPAQQAAAPAASDAAPAPALKKSANSASAPMSMSPGDGAAPTLPPAKPQRASMSGATTDELPRQSAQKGSPAPSTTPATASTPMSIISGDSTPSSPRIKVLAVKNQDAPVSGATADQPVQQSAQKDSPLSSIAEDPAVQPSPSSQTSDQGAAPAPATGPAWPDPVVTTLKTPEPSAAPSDARTESGQPTADVRASDSVERTAQGSAPVTKAEMGGSSWPIAIFPVAALGLVVAGFLLRIVMKISVGRRQPVVVDRRDFDWIDDQYEHELREDQFVHQPDGLTDYLHRSAMQATLDSGSSQGEGERPDNAHDWDAASGITDKISRRQRRRIGIDPRESDWVGKLVDDLQSSLMAPNDYRSGPPLQADDSWPDDERCNDEASQSSDEIRKREEVLERLRRDLDRLLQPRNAVFGAPRNRSGRAHLGVTTGPTLDP
jgi:hypothetical protein